MKLKFIFIFFITCFSLQGQTEVAKVGNYSITKEELVTRFELTPQIENSTLRNTKKMLAKLLYTIIAEKLWAQEAINQGYDTTYSVNKTLSIIEKLHLKDALWKEEITKKTKITKGSWQQAYNRSLNNLKLSYIRSNSEKEIVQIYNELKKGTAFYTILANRPENKKQEKPYMVSFGTLQKETEDILYALKPNEFTQPIKTPFGWAIFKLMKIESVKITTVKEAEALEKQVKKIVEQQATNKAYAEFRKKFFKGIKIKANGDLFRLVGNQIVEELKKNQYQQKLTEKKKISLTENNIYSIENNLGKDTLSLSFINIGNKIITIKDFLREFIFEGFSTETIDRNAVFGKLNIKVKNFIEGELLASEAYKRGLQNLPEVKNDMKIWKSYYLADLFNKHFIKETFISKEETQKYYQEKKDFIKLPESVKIIEILTESPEKIDTILQKISEGKSFKELAKKYNKRTETLNSNGVYDFFPITKNGKIGKIAAGMQIGEIYGPLKIDAGWSIFKLIAQKGAIKPSGKSFKEIKSDLRKRLSLENYNKKILEATIKMAEKYGIKINEDVLNSANVINLNMLVYRLYGFGGKTLAVPLTTPFHSWYKLWKNQKKHLP